MRMKFSEVRPGRFFKWSAYTYIKLDILEEFDCNACVIKNEFDEKDIGPICFAYPDHLVEIVSADFKPDNTIEFRFLKPGDKFKSGCGDNTVFTKLNVFASVSTNAICSNYCGYCFDQHETVELITE